MQCRLISVQHNLSDRTKCVSHWDLQLCVRESFPRWSIPNVMTVPPVRFGVNIAVYVQMTVLLLGGLHPVVRQIDNVSDEPSNLNTRKHTPETSVPTY